MNKLYADTVTLYHADAAAQTVVRTVLHGVYCQHGSRAHPAADGTRQEENLLLVVPEETARYGTDYTLRPGDRVCRGVGPELRWQDWPAFLPAVRQDTAVVDYVLVLFWRGARHHIEAGTWWGSTGTGAHSLTR